MVKDSKLRGERDREKRGDLATGAGAQQNKLSLNKS
jgi:hypothetical protein